MKDRILLFLFLIPTFLFAQYPTGTNKSRLGYQTTGDGLIWRGVAGDTVNKPNSRNYPYFQLDTVNSVLYRYIATQGNWQAVGGGSIDIDSLVYATRFWVNSNFFPLQGGLLTGTGGAGYVGFPLQSSPPATPATGFSLFAGSTGNNISWMQPDGFFRRLVSPTTGVARQYQFMARSYTLADSADVAALPTGTGTTNYYTKWSSTNALTIGNLFDNNTAVSILNSKPFQLGQWTTAGRPAGTSGYMGWNTTLTGLDWYNGTRWATGLESTFARGTATYIPYFDSNGQLTENINHQFVDSPTPKLVVPNGSSTVRGIEFYNSNLGGGTSGFRQNNNVVSIIGNDATRLDVGNAICDFLATNATFKLNSRITFNEPTTTALQVGQGYRAIFLDPIASGGTPRVLMFGTANSANTKFSLVGATGFLALNMGATDARYQLETISTNAWGFPRGTVAQRPTITASTSPVRFNTDSTAFEYGESVGTWRQLATRAYARSLVSALPTTNIYTANGTLSGNRTITGGNYNVDWDNISGFNLISGGATGATSITSDVYSSMKQYVNLAKTKYVQKYNTFDSRALTVSAFPNFVDIFEWNTTGSTNYEWGNATILDTTNSVFFYKHGGRYFPSFHTLGGSRPASGSAYRLTPVFDFNQSVIGNGSNWSPMATFRMGSDTAMQVKQDGTIEFSEYGTGTKEAADLSKTQSNYIAGFATDGTVLDLEQKRDTTIYIDDADYDFSAALTTAQIARRYNRVIFWMTTTGAAGSDSELTLHTPDANLMQVEYLIHSVDEPAGFDNKIVFGTNNAVDSTNGLVTNYYPSAGDGIHIRAGLRSGVYKYRYSN